jgi:hypothetical protein
MQAVAPPAAVALAKLRKAERQRPKRMPIVGLPAL